MTFATIMVFIDPGEKAGERITTAVGLATRFNSLLIGLAGWPLRKDEMLEPAAAAFPLTDQSREEKIREQHARLGENFRRLAEANPHGLEWRSSVHFPREVITREARAADLVVIGREALPGDVYHTYDPGTVILAAGRPVLVVPHGIREVQASRVVLAWKETREARRAVRDALPFLKKSQIVMIAVANPQSMQGVDEQIADVARYLARHGVTVSQQIVTAADEEEGHILLRLAKEHHADLIVAGAYGRTRLSEWIFGGVTRHLLMASTVPCLFSN